LFSLVFRLTGQGQPQELGIYVLFYRYIKQMSQFLSCTKMKRINLLLVSISLLPFFSFSQNGEGGGAYLQNNGKLYNSIVTHNSSVQGFGVSGTSGEIANSNIVYNTCLPYDVMNIGDLLFDDGTLYRLSYDTNGNIVFPTGYSASRVVGVCCWRNKLNRYENSRNWFIAVDEAQTYWCPNGYVNGGGWNPPDIPNLYNFSDPAAALVDESGKSNTQTIVNCSCFIFRPNGESDTLNTSNCAAKYCTEYKKGGFQWYLPSLGQMYQLEKNLTVINNVLNKLGKIQISNSLYWTSTEISSQQAWQYSFPSSSMRPQYGTKKSNFKVRPMTDLPLPQQ
ncbi:MAG TPA: hypothetical protein P5085_08350, partial [Paludibacteraceae bacterium]|nr:hypothetical protein [Paludibacteraceae bacterium]